MNERLLSALANPEAAFLLPTTSRRTLEVSLSVGIWPQADGLLVAACVPARTRDE